MASPFRKGTNVSLWGVLFFGVGLIGNSLAKYILPPVEGEPTQALLVAEGACRLLIWGGIAMGIGGWVWGKFLARSPGEEDSPPRD